METDRQPQAIGDGADQARVAAVTAELDRILNSAVFRNARRSQDFLRYVVTNSVEGRSELLKERTIGANVFQRAPDYDTGDDSIVRVKASELRKRLAQFYLEAGPGPEVTIELPAGAYVPEFRWHDRPGDFAAAPPEPVLATRAKPSGRIWRVALGLGLIGIGVVLLFVRAGSATPLDRFWEPMLRSGRPVLLCVAHPVVFQVRRPTRDVLSQNPPPELVPSGDISRDGDHFVGYGDAYALAQLSGYLRSRQKPVSIRMGNEISFADLRDHPAILIGAFTNQWTMEMTSSLRFVFDVADGAYVIRDQMDYAGRTWQRDPAKPDTDFVVLSRIFDSRSGQTFVIAAGLAHTGTYMAGELLTNPDHFERVTRDAPADWTTKNMQLVITGEVIGKTPGPPKVVASWYW